MTSIYKPLIKNFIITILLIIGIALSAFITFQHSYASSRAQNNAINNIDKKTTENLGDISKSAYEHKLQREINRLIPGSKTFSPYFLQQFLTNPNKQKEA